MTKEEYNLLFHKEQLNLVAFKRLMDCDEEVLRLVNRAIENEREVCTKVCEENATDLSEGDWDSACNNCADLIRARGDEA